MVRLMSMLTAIGMGLAVLSPLLVTAVFYLNQPTIADRYCVNRNIPELHCDGKCFLAQTLREIEQAQRPSDPEPSPTAEPPFLLLFHTASDDLMVSTVSASTWWTGYPIGSYDAPLAEMFRPPRKWESA